MIKSIIHSLLVFMLIGGEAVAASLTITPTQEPEVVFDWKQQACEEWDVPDAPVRAFRDAQGRVQLYSSGARTRREIGVDTDHMQHECTVRFTGNDNPDPAGFSGKDWLAAVYTEDGVTVHALIHNEYHGDKYGRCDAMENVNQRCWRNNITSALSTDGGEHFSLAEKPLIATLPYRYEGAEKQHIGYFNPTNIIKYDGFYYTMFAAEGFKAQRSGICLMRTETLEDPASWRAWDGKGFGVRFADPYSEDIADPRKHVCVPVSPRFLRNNQASLIRLEPQDMFLLTLTAHRKGEDGKVEAGFYVSSSKDLIHWDAPQLIMPLPISAYDYRKATPKQCSEGAIYTYPALLDDDSESRNFETTDETASLYYVRMRLDGQCQPTKERDLLRQKVEIDVADD